MPSLRNPLARRPRAQAIRRLLSALGLALPLFATLHSHEAKAFCGFYVAKADAKLFNKASQVVLARDGDRNILSMASDYQGDLSEFALVVPVPTKLEKNQIHVGEPKAIERVDAFTSPRLVEYFDPNPCRRHWMNEAAPSSAPKRAGTAWGGAARDKALGVTVEAQYEVGEYDILILSATQSSGLETWLTENGYKIPEGASSILGDYIKNDMKFFVAKVNLKRKSKEGTSQLNPIQMAFESPKFILPLRLGTINSNGTQDLFIYALSKSGRIEPTNYRMTKIPTGMDVPLFVKNEFKDFYKDMFSNEVKKEDMRTVFLEYAWNTGNCDPCAADPLTPDELRKLGVFWLDRPEGSSEDRQSGRGASWAPFDAPASASASQRPAQPQPPGRRQWRPIRPFVPSSNVFVTRLHVRYDAAHFPEDLGLQVTGNNESFQGRYVLRHPWQGEETCEAASEYKHELARRHEKEATTLASLTGWDINKIRDKMSLKKDERERRGGSGNWWDDIWK